MFKILKKPVLLMALLGLFIACGPEQEKEASDTQFQVPVEYYELDNGLKVILSPDHSTPTATIAVYYNIGFRIEPRDRTGFAHLFEHMMFQGSQNLGKMEFVKLVENNGGVLNGSTRFDFTNYFEVVPAHKVETMLWAEADRMKGLSITQDNLTNQQGVVKNEVKVNVLNQPYGGFPWLDMPQKANENWYNAHNFYGDLEDLDAATLEDVQDFFDTYYSPNNAALAVVGDFEIEEVKGWIAKYYGSIPATALPELPDLSEPKQTAEKRFEKEDALATQPAIAVAYHMPDRNSPDYYAMGLLHQILLQGDNSLLHKALVKDKGYTASVSGGINWPLGNMYNYNGPMLWMFYSIYDQSAEADTVLATIDEVIEGLRETGVTREMLDKALVRVRSNLYDELGGYGIGRADLLCSFALFDNDPARINSLEEEFRKVTPAIANATLQNYLIKQNRTILTLKPTAGQASAAGSGISQ